MTLSSLGWDDFFAPAFQPYLHDGLLPARVAQEHRHAYELLTPDGALHAECTGRLLHTATARDALPAVGDWVAVRRRPDLGPTASSSLPKADIHAILPRRTKFSRRAAGDAAVEQIVAANVDTVLLVSALDHTHNLRRIERYLAVAWESGSEPVVVLNKSDLHENPAGACAEVAAIAPGAAVVRLSATGNEGLAQLTPWLAPGRTLALLGASGVGKSTLINRLLGHNHQATGAISAAVGKGRHTTTHRELIVADSGVLLIDTPGMRELQLWDVAPGALETAFADIAALAGQCRFRDCGHRAEPGCAVQAALETGALDFDRWQSFQKLQREQAYAARKVDPQLARATRQHWKKLHQAAREHARHKHEG